MLMPSPGVFTGRSVWIGDTRIAVTSRLTFRRRGTRHAQDRACSGIREAKNTRKAENRHANTHKNAKLKAAGVSASEGPAGSDI